MATINNLERSTGLTAGSLEVVYCDEELLAINKPAGLLTLPDGYDKSLPHLKDVLEPDFGRLWIVHRLDRDTSGLVLLARSAKTHSFLNQQFEQRQVIKRYQAITCGSPEWQTKQLRLPLRINGSRHRTVVDYKRGKSAATDFKVIERFGPYALIESVPHTGRTHQIRAHLAALNLPLLGDILYGGQPALFTSMIKPGFTGGFKAECPLIQRCALHACSLEFKHPLTLKTMELAARFPRDFMAALRMLRRYSH